MKKKLLLVLLAMLSFNAIHAEITWNLSDDGTLTISGTDMPDYGFTRSPWSFYSYTHEIKEVVIEEGVTNIGRAAFFALKVTSVSIPTSFCGIPLYNAAISPLSSTIPICIPPKLIAFIPLLMFRTRSLNNVVFP